MRPVLTTFRSGPGGEARDMHGCREKDLVNLEATNRKGEVASCNENHSLALAAMQKRPTSKSLQCGSWVRVDMREVSYFSNERHRQKNVQTTLNKTLSRALALHARRGFLGPRRGQTEREVGDRTKSLPDEMVSLAHPIYAGLFIMYVALNK